MLQDGPIIMYTPFKQWWICMNLWFQEVIIHTYLKYSLGYKNFTLDASHWKKNYPPWNQQFAPENGWVEYDRFLLGWTIFRCELLVSGRVKVWIFSWNHVWPVAFRVEKTLDMFVGEESVVQSDKSCSPNRCFSHRIPSLKLTTDPWKSVVGRWTFRLGWPIFRSYVSFREGNPPPVLGEVSKTQKVHN